MTPGPFITDDDVMSTMSDWTDAVVTELEIADVVDRATVQSLVLDLTKDVAHGVARPAAPLTAYLLGVAVGRSVDPEVTASRLADRVRGLVATWPAAEPPGDQD